MLKTVFHVHREMKTGEQSGALPELTLAWSQIQRLALADTLVNDIGDDENSPTADCL
jgi:hypothetical protein